MCEQRITFAPCSMRYLIVGSAPTILFSSVIAPSFIGTLKSHLTRTLLALYVYVFYRFLIHKTISLHLIFSRL